MNKKFLKIGEVAAQLGVTTQTVRRYEKNGLLTPIRSVTNQRLYKQEEINELLGDGKATAINVFYVRESANSDKALETQIEMLTNAYGTPTRIFKDTASGLNENRKGLNALLEAAKDGEFNTVCITAKDRLTRFGYSYLERMLKDYGIEIKVLDDVKHVKIVREELIQDFMSLLSTFSGKYYNLRSNEHKRKFLKDVETQLND